jgi:hypothetical protein
MPRLLRQLGDGHSNIEPSDLLVVVIIVEKFGQGTGKRVKATAGVSALICPQMRDDCPRIRAAAIFSDQAPSLVKDDQSFLSKVVGGMPILAQLVCLLPKYGLKSRGEGDEVFRVSLFHGRRFTSI